jgi:hypothetical protein
MSDLLSYYLRKIERLRVDLTREIADLLAIVDHDLADAGGNISPDWRFGIAYNGALKLCTILLHASGYRPEKTLQHYCAITAMPVILGAEREDDANYLDRCAASAILLSMTVQMW